MSRYSKKRSASAAEDSDDGEPQVVLKAVKKSKNAASTGAPEGKDDEGNPFWEVGRYILQILQILQLRDCAADIACSCRTSVASVCRSSKTCGWSISANTTRKTARCSRARRYPPRAPSYEMQADSTPGNFSVHRAVQGAARGRPRHQQDAARDGTFRRRRRHGRDCRGDHGEVEEGKFQAIQGQHRGDERRGRGLEDPPPSPQVGQVGQIWSSKGCKLKAERRMLETCARSWELFAAQIMFT